MMRIYKFAFTRRYFVIRRCIYILIITFILYSIYPRSTTLSDIFNNWKVTIADDLIQSIESEVPRITALSDMITYQSYFTKQYHFLHLPKRIKYVSFSEMTSSNPDTANPLSPDFTFHLSYNKKETKIFEDFGCGCIYRIFVLPPFTSFLDKIDKLTSKDMNDLTIVLELDGTSASYTIRELMEAQHHPFYHPMSSRNERPISGVGVYSPLCYERMARVYYVDDNDYPSDILNATVDCVSNELKCPIKQYSSVSYLKLPRATQCSALELNYKNLHHLKTFAGLLADPASNGPHAEVGCNLFCIPLRSNDRAILYKRERSSRVITTVLMTILRASSEDVADDWSDIFLVAEFDAPAVPQINISVGSLFISRGRPNDFRGAGYGRLNRYCQLVKEDNSRRRHESLDVGYLYLPMPFWKSATVSLQYHRNAGKPQQHEVLACFQTIESKNFYDPSSTGHLHAEQTFYSSQTSKRRRVTRIAGGFGQLVGVNVEVHNLRPNLEGPLTERWAALQADPLVFIDGLRVPRVRGTGLEDYFSYAHGFAGAANSSYSFFGVPLSVGNVKDGNTMICYRQHLLDPITFRDSLEFVMEGTDGRLYSQEAEEVSLESFDEKLSRKEGAFSYLSLYYFKAHPARKLCDKISFCDESSLRQHGYRSSADGSPFSLDDVKFIGDVRDVRRDGSSFCGMSYPNNTVIRFTLVVPAAGLSNLIFTRTFHMLPFQWNDKCLVKINGVDLGPWVFPMGPTTKTYSLRDDFMQILPQNVVKSSSSRHESRAFDFEIIVLSSWRDVSYELCSVQ